MKIIDALEISFNTFAANKMRTLLTMLGVSVGIGAIVFLVSLGYGLQELTINKISSISALTTFEVTTEGSTILKLNDEMINKLKKIEGVKSVNPLYANSAQINIDGSWTDASLYGASRDYLELESPKLTTGKIIENNETDTIVTEAALQALSIPSGQAVGKTVQAKYTIEQSDGSEKEEITTFVISGVIAENSASYVYVPIETFAGVDKTFASAKIKANSQDSMAKLRVDLEKTGLKVSTIGDTISQLQKIFSIARIILFIFGFVALLVASIGMFNTLTISLLERTREIGIMKALGSTDKFIRKIFLMEAMIIGAFGGLLGVLLGWGLAVILDYLVSLLARSLGGLPVQLFLTPPWFVLAIIIFSLLIGLSTGIYPAKRASRLNPLDALRYE